MLGQAYICSNNRILTEIVDCITISWETKFIGRRIISEKYYELFDHNGYYFENDQYDTYGIIANINPTVDENGYITEINGYKVKDKSSGHGRPQTDDMDFSKRDISHFSKILDSVTHDHVTEEYEVLRKSFAKGEVLPGGYIFAGTTAKGISVVTPTGSTVLMSKAKLVQAIAISHDFIDVLYDTAVLESAPEYFAHEEIPIYLSLFSKIDPRFYRNYEDLVEAAKYRALLREAEKGYHALIDAVKADDVEEAKLWIQFVPLVVGDPEPPILIAARNDNLKLVQILLEAGAYSKETVVNNDKSTVSPLLIAIKNKNYAMVELICQYGGAELDSYSGTEYNFWIRVPQKKFSIKDIFSEIGIAQDLKALKIVLPYVARSQYKMPFNPDIFCELTDCDRDYMINISGAAICWPVQIVEKVYAADREKCRRMLEQGCAIEVIDYLIHKQDFDLFAIAITHHSNIRPRQAFRLVYSRGGDWYRMLKQYSSPDFNYMVLRQDRDKYLATLIREERFGEFKSAVKNMDIEFPIEALDAFCNYRSDDGITAEMEEFLSYVLENSKYVENIERGSTNADVAFHFYTDALLRHASYELGKRFIERYPLRITIDDKRFKETFEKMVEQRNDNLFDSLLEKKIQYESARVASEQWLRYADFSSFRYKTLYEIFYMIVFRYELNERDTHTKFSFVNPQKAAVNTEKWFLAMRCFLKHTSVNEINNVLSTCKYKRYMEANTALEFAEAAGIMNKAFLALLM